MVASRLRAIQDATRPKMFGRVMISGPSGAGKALRDDQPVLTPYGWVPIVDLNPGDTVYGADGNPCIVTGVFPQGVRPLNEVEFSDGTVIIADDDHLWFTETVYQRADGSPGKVHTTTEIADTLRTPAGRAFHYVPMPGPVDHPTVDVPLDPYVLGVLLGDGGMSRRGVVLSNPDDEIVEAVRKVFDLTHLASSDIDYQVRGAPAVMRRLGLLGLRSHEKHIPREYLFGDVEQRHALLQGLLDTDGWAGGSTCEFVSTSADLAEGVVALVQSLGGTVTVTTKIPTFTYLGEKRTGRLAWRCYVKLPGGIEPFRLTRKAAAYKPRTKYQPWRQIVDVRPTRPGSATCISVDAADHLFLTAGYIPTHNTWTSLATATRLAAFEHWHAEHGDEELPDISTLDTSSVTEADILMIDTERESALTYADVFKFQHLAWRPPYDAAELDVSLQELDGAGYKVIIVDSFSKFWHGAGGILDTAGGAIGGWKAARPIQERLVETVVATNAHIILAVRSKMEYLIEGGKGNQTVSKVGMAPMQDDNLVYEMNVALDIDMQHDITVTKSRTQAVPVGRRYPAGHEKKMAADYAEWLAGGVPPANRDDVDRIVGMFSQVVDKDQRHFLKEDFIKAFGMPHALTAAQVANAVSWLEREMAERDIADTPETDPPDDAPDASETPETPEPDPDAPDTPEVAETDTRTDSGCIDCGGADHDTIDCPGVSVGAGQASMLDG